MNTKATIATSTIIALVIGFGAGYYLKGTMTPVRGARGGAFAQGGANAGRFGANGQRPVVGTIQSITADHMTVQSMDGSTHAVLIDNNTQYRKTTDATQSDFTQGTSVMVVGTQNPDGSITATNIQTAPQRPTQSSPSPAAQ
ncbi:MAG TPA: DUF5666 domain-containing protein [Candidatus Andersenbacteria bacterium]|nr:DUF5666 domain-containing protein [Candidatus Andersenbacteria bacterium]